MSKSVEFDASKCVENGVEIGIGNPSDVYLGLFWRSATKDIIGLAEFRDLAETWLRIRIMEESVSVPDEDPGDDLPELDYKAMYNKLVDSLLEEDVHPATPDFWVNIPEEVQIDQHTFVSKSDAEAEIAAMKAEQAPKKQKNAAKSEAGKNSFARRKRAALEAAKSARASGCTLQGIADQSGLSLSCVMDLLNGVAKPVTDWAKLEKGLKKLGHPPIYPKEEVHKNEQEG